MPYNFYVADCESVNECFAAAEILAGKEIYAYLRTVNRLLYQEGANDEAVAEAL